MRKADDITAMEPSVGLRNESHEPFGDPLAPYESESPTGSAGVAAAPVAVSSPASVVSLQTPITVQDRGPVSLDQVLNRLGHIAWPEAVAIVEALCVTLTSDVSGNAAVPELPHVSITAHGTVVVGGWAAAGEPGPRLARALHALAAAGTVPVPVRLFITKWASTTTQHSISDFGKELAYFARPDGVALIRGVYERAAALPAASPKPQPAVRHDAKPKNAPRVARSGRSRRVAAAVIVMSAVVAAVFVGRGLSTSTGQASRLAVDGFVDQTMNAAKQVVGTLAERAGFATPASSGSSQTGSSAQDTQPTATRGTATGVRGSGASRLANARGNTGSRAGDAAGASAPPTIALGFSTPEPEAFAVPALTPADARADAAVTSRGEEELHQIYSIEDRDVTPPAIRNPQLPPPLFSGVEEDRNTIELIISEKGTVERVRLLSTPRRMADMMLLSGAKTWSFEPASRQGQSVRYRLLLSWAATP